MTSSEQGTRSAPTRLAGRYDIQQQIGSGATAITWRGWDRRLERPVAIKILRDAFVTDETYVQRFRAEARTAASVAHGNVVDIYDFGQHDGELYIVMQLVAGEDLKQLITREAPLAPAHAGRIILQVLSGLRAIHAAGIVHRDIKPQNVLIGHDGIARLTDFGVAHRDDDQGVTTVGTTVGTAAYMAPEQARGEPVTQATDLYAVGVMFYEMLTATLPFTAPTAMATMLAHIQQEPTPPSARLAGHVLSPEIDGVILQALAKDPARRFRTARAMQQAVRFAVQAGPTAAADCAASATSPRALPAPPPEPDSGAARRARYLPQAEAVPTVPSNAGAGLSRAVRALLVALLLAGLGFAVWFAYNADVVTTSDEPPLPSPTVDITRPTSAPAVPPPIEPSGQPTLTTALPTVAPPVPNDDNGALTPIPPTIEPISLRPSGINAG